VVLSLVQGTILSFSLQGGAFGPDTVINPGWQFQAMTVLTLTSGTAFIMWLGEQITERGIGNGISLIIFAGIVVRIPGAISTTFRLLEQGELRIPTLLILLALMLLVIAVIIFFEGAQRRIPIQYAKKIVGRKVYGGRSTYFPLRINTAGVIPPIFASSILLFPVTIAGSNARYGGRVTVVFAHAPAVRCAVGDVFFCYFYTVMINRSTADNIKYGGCSGDRPGRDGGLHRPGAGAGHARGGAVHRVGLHPAHVPDLEPEHAVLLRWHGAAHRGGCGQGYDGADREPPDHAELQRLPEGGAHEGPLRSGVRRRGRP
jgi:preprotein translocase subunit SecY